MRDVDLSGLSTGVIGDGFGDIERGIFAAHVVGAHFTFRDHASKAAFETRGHSSLLERISSRRRFWLFAQNHQLFAV